jgi:chromosome segregation ATPase
MTALFNPSFVSFSDYSQQAEGIPHDAAAPRFEASPKMNAKLEGAFLKAAKEALVEVLDGLDTNTLRDQVRRSNLQFASSCLPEHFASISRIKAMLDKLVAISEQMQQAYSEHEATLKQDDQSVIEAKHAILTKKAALLVTAEELAFVEKQKLEVSTEVAKLNRVLLELGQKEVQLSEAQAVQGSEVNELEHKLGDTVAKASKEAVDDLRMKTTDLNQQANQLFGDLNHFRSNGN